MPTRCPFSSVAAAALSGRKAQVVVLGTRANRDHRPRITYHWITGDDGALGAQGPRKVAAWSNDSCKLWLATGAAPVSGEAAVWAVAALLAGR
jgi:hypothetical protein